MADRGMKVTQVVAKQLVADSPKPETSGNGHLPANNLKLAHAYRDKLVRAICDYHVVCPNRAERDRLVKLIQGVELWT